MSITETLRVVIENIDGAKGVALVGMDGIVVEEQKIDPAMDLQSLGAEYCSLIKQVDKTMSGIGEGDSEEVSIQTEKAVMVVRRVHEGYFLILAIAKDGNFGKARYLLRKAEINLKGEL